jgi:chemosensory pili system protein ChpA (sensor histidine kinase/response regulator)
MRKPKRAVVFLVDDDNDLRESVEQVLEGEGYLVLGARDGTEALARMRGISIPAVAVIDLMMPGMNGWELAKAMKADPALRNIPIIVISVKDRAPVEGVDRVLNKPVTAEELLALVKEFLPRQTTHMSP